MKVCSRCKSCLNEIEFSSKAKTRVKFVILYGKNVSIKCNTCKTTNHVHVNDLRAQSSKSTQIIAGVIFLFGTSFLLYYIAILYINQTGFLNIIVLSSSLLIPGLIYNRINDKDRKRVRNFNRYKFK